MKSSNFIAMVACFSCMNFSSVAATLTVTTTADSGAGSLRSAIAAAGAGDTIDFAVAGPAIILTSGELVINQDLTIQGPGAGNLAISGNHGSRVFNLNGTVTISDLTIKDGEAPDCCPSPLQYGHNYLGGGILSSGVLTLNRCVVTGNSAGNRIDVTGANWGAGGGVSASTLYLNDCSISYNTATGWVAGTSSGGGVQVTTLYATRSTFNNNRAFATDGATGGGIFFSSGLITDCTISGNAANADMAGTDGFGSGGGIATFPAATGTTLTIINTTISGNSATSDPLGYLGPAKGGGLSIGSSTAIQNSTITGNSPGGAGSWQPMSVTIQNTIVAGNLLDRDVFSPVVSQGHNLIGASAVSAGLVDGVNGDQVGTKSLPIDALLGPLQNNGGPTFTHALLPGSPAFNAGDNTGAPATDQRGFPRIAGGTIDIGAYELDILPDCTLTCPENITVELAPGQSSAVVNYTPPTVNGNCSGMKVECQPPSGSIFPVGTTVVICTAVDSNSQSVFPCRFNVTVLPTPCSTPQITVNVYSGFNPSGGGAPYSGLAGSFNASAITFASDFGYGWQPFGLFNFGADITGALSVTADGSYTFTLDSADGSLLFIDGVLVVDNGNRHSPIAKSGTATLSAGTHPFEIQFFQCCFGVSGVDLFLPLGVSYACPRDCLLTCPSDISVSNDLGTCGAVVNYAPPMTSGACSGLVIACNPQSGNSFPVGTTVVTCTATDANNAVITSCSFNVTVNDTEAPVPSCVATSPPQRRVNPDAILVRPRLFATDNCDPDPLIYIGSNATAFVAGPFHNGDLVTIIHGASLTPSSRKPLNPNIAAEIVLNGDPLIWAVDSAGNAAIPVKCQ
jgi:hypothetical protein